eukprot:4658213-Pyramimonas_sp.AAC.1
MGVRNVDFCQMLPVAWGLLPLPLCPCCDVLRIDQSRDQLPCVQLYPYGRPIRRTRAQTTGPKVDEMSKSGPSGALRVVDRLR